MADTTAPMDTSDGGTAATASSSINQTPAAAAATTSSSTATPTPSSATTATSSTTTPIPSNPIPSPQPGPNDDEEEDALINENDQFDEEDLTDVKETAPGGKKRRGRPPAAGSASATSILPPSDALDRLNELLQRTEQFAKFVPTKAEQSKQKGRGPRGGRHHERAEEDAEDKELVKDELEEAEGKQPSWPDHLDVQPSSVIKAGGLPMRDYQLEALNWLIKLHDQNLNGILADEMGLGKTLESLSLLAYLKQYRHYEGPHLIIVPKSTSSNWQREVNRWTNNLKCFKFHGNQEEREALKPLVAQHDVTITTYEMVIREKGFFGKQKWKYIYIDEAHRIKNENSLLSRVVRTFNSEHRLLITGTPLQNNLHELWALLNFLVPQLFHSSEDFAAWFDFTEPSQRNEIVSRLHRLLRPFLLRRLKSDVEKALLPKIETKLFVGMSAMQKAWYKKILERDIEVLNATNTSKVRLLNIVMQLRKVCNHPYLFHGAEPGPPYLEGEHIVENSSKMVLLDKLLKKLQANGNRVLIFSQMTRILDILEDFSRYRGYDYCRIDGQTKQDERDESMEAYNAPNSKKFIFLLSTRAGGLGINLQTADTVILFDSDWNPQMDLQAMDRAHRIGQKKQVTVFRFVVEHSIEQKMVERATKKLFLDALVVKQGRLNDAEKSVTAQELQDMVRFGANRIFQSTGDTEVTDADIDLILSRGTELTRLENEKLKENTGNDLLNFSLTDNKDTNFQMFEGKSVAPTDRQVIRRETKKIYDWTDANVLIPLLFLCTSSSRDYTGFRAQTGFEFIEPAKRERKSNYDINQYYRDALRVNDKKTPKQLKEYKPAQRFDYQFFNTERLEALERKDHESKQKLFHLKQAVRMKEREEKRQREEREKEERRKLRYQKMRQARLDAAAAGQTLPEAKEGEEDGMDSDEEGTTTNQPTTANTSASPPADGPTKMEIDDELVIKKEESVSTATSSAATPTPTNIKAEPTSTATDDTVMKSEEDVDMDAGRRKSTRPRPSSNSVKKEGEASSSPAPTPAPQPTGDDEDDAHEDDAIEDAELMAEAGCLTVEERAELQRLQEEGFGTWSRRHIISLTKAMEKFGRNDLANIKMCVEEKTPDEVEKYYYAFWSKYKQIKDWDKMIKQIERGEARLEKQKALQRVIDNKVKRYRGNFEKMTIPYPTTQQKSFTEEEDKFLIVSLHRLGYGNWEDLKSAIRTSWMFRFDWYLKSRTCGELSKRVEYLLKLLEKEQSDWEEKKHAAELKKRAKVIKEAQKLLAASAPPTDGPSPTKKKSTTSSSTTSSNSSHKKKSDDSTSTKKKDGKDHHHSSSHKDKGDKDSSKKDHKDKDGKSHKKEKSSSSSNHKSSTSDDKSGGDKKEKKKEHKDKDKSSPSSSHKKKDHKDKDKDKEHHKSKEHKSDKDSHKESKKRKEVEESESHKKKKVKTDATPTPTTNTTEN